MIILSQISKNMTPTRLPRIVFSRSISEEGFTLIQHASDTSIINASGKKGANEVNQSDVGLPFLCKITIIKGLFLNNVMVSY